MGHKMADEIKLTINSRVVNGDFKDRWDMGQLSLDQAAQGALSGVIDVGTTAEDLDVGDVATPGILILRNLDDTNYVEIGKDVSASFEAIAKLKPGYPAVLPIASGVTLQLRANSAACNVQFLLLED
jgi:hypothetical protein